MASDFLDDLSDEELAQRMGSGDLAAFGELYQRYSGQVYHRAMAKVGPEDAWDIMQETFLKAFQRQQKAHRQQSILGLIFNFKAWLSTIVTNTGIDHQRKQRAGPLEELDGYELPEPSPEDAFIWKEQLQEAIERLKPREREILSLSTQGYTTKEIAQQLQLGHRSVSTYLSSARKKLYEIFPKKKTQCKRNGEIRIQTVKATPETC
jgi:RNA polymerase sigma-70 factor (ECF subfamily)